MRDFLKEFQDRVKKMDRGPIKAVSETNTVRLFNVHKRSLPPGVDKIVVMGVSKADGEWWIEKVLKAKIYSNDEKESKTLIYFDLIPENASPKERSIYFNTGSLTKEN